MADQASPRSRRAILAAGLASGAAALASALGRPGAVRGANGGYAVLGQTNEESSPTYFRNTIGASVLVAETLGGLGTAVTAQAVAGMGVFGESSSGDAVHGESETGYGVYGLSSSSYGVYGTSTSQVGSSTSSLVPPGMPS